MISSRGRRLAVFLTVLLVFGIAVGVCLQKENRVCMGVRILSEAQQAKLQECIYEDLSWSLLHNDQPAAVDLETSTVYIAQDIQPGTEVKDLKGILKLEMTGYELSFAPDDAFSDLAAAVKEGHRFRLNVAVNPGTCMQYDVVFTTLPVLRLDGTFSHENDEGRKVSEGELCLWTPLDPDAGRYTTKTSRTQWHTRGKTSSYEPKKPRKISLKNGQGENRNVAFLGLGSDDDWILNPMNLDDTNLKEQLFMRLWNALAEKEKQNPRMSAGAYVEVVQNGSYTGVYLLQRRMDGKYLKLEDGDVLLKGANTWTPESLETAYEIVSTDLEDGTALSLMDPVWQGTDYSMLDLDNFLDESLFVQYASALDNRSYKNTFYLLKKQEDGYVLSLVPWDTDMSWGVGYQNNGFVYDYEKSLQKNVLRMEYEGMLELYPDLNQRLARRWFTLREELLETGNVLSVLEEEYRSLTIGGAMQRDLDRWGLYYEGEDSVENLRSILAERLIWLDSHYAQFLE